MPRRSLELEFDRFPEVFEGERAFVALSGIFEFWVLQETPSARWHWIIMRHGTAIAMREGFPSRVTVFDNIRTYVANREHHAPPRRLAAALKKERLIAAARAEEKREADETRRRHLPIERNTIIWLMRHGDRLKAAEVGDLVGLTVTRVNQICRKIEARAVWRAQDRGKPMRPFLRRLAAAGCFGEARILEWGRLPATVPEGG